MLFNIGVASLMTKISKNVFIWYWKRLKFTSGFDQLLKENTLSILASIDTAKVGTSAMLSNLPNATWLIILRFQEGADAITEKKNNNRENFVT